MPPFLQAGPCSVYLIQVSFQGLSTDSLLTHTSSVHSFCPVSGAMQSTALWSAEHRVKKSTRRCFVSEATTLALLSSLRCAPTEMPTLCSEGLALRQFESSTQRSGTFARRFFLRVRRECRKRRQCEVVRRGPETRSPQPEHKCSDVCKADLYLFLAGDQLLSLARQGNQFVAF